MKKVIGFLNTGMEGCSVAEAYVFKDDATDEQIDKHIFEEACNWAEMYKGVELAYISEEEQEEENYYEGTDFVYREDIGSSWEYYDAEKHDGEHSGNGRFEETFKDLISELMG